MNLVPPIKPQQHFQCRSSHAAAALHLLLLAVALAMASGTARAHAVHAPCCNLLQGVNLVPCLGMATSGGGAVNISAACCSSLNQALDAGRRCLCSLPLANGVLAGLIATLIPTLPMVLPLPGCYLYAPPLATCQVTLLQTDYDAPPASPSVTASVGDAGGGAVDPPPPPTAVMPPWKNASAAGTKDGGTTDRSAGNGSREAREEQSVRRSDACRRPGVGEGRMYMLIFAVVMAVFLFD
ncbi:non-specific lipid transfer protein GPI-anchored 29-like [Triticum urartu]|uniref:Bifunctional inhibitor/plant lipid transfer protein/seed storage helical domain-containing protein n=1 Tax=Triticum urartu TaxID=4572 RepID=A0A8R7RA85_TRIUA|nr:non-specific lipid transfer protein GPI-anchored 29-like [Triticum urartu]